MTECVFCKIIKGEISAEFVYQNAEIVAFKDIHPKAPVHVLIIPRKHLESIRQTTNEDRQLLGKLLLAAGKIAEDLGVNQGGYRLIINNGGDAGQVVPHLHIHLLAGRQLD